MVVHPGTAALAGLGAADGVTLLYQRHALGLTRLAFLMLGDTHTAEDVVQDAFCGLYRGWDRVKDRDRTLGYLRSSVINGCRSALRKGHRDARVLARPEAALLAALSAEAEAIAGEDQREVVAAIRRLPARQREAVVLRYFADLPESETARAMGVSRGTVKSTTARGLAALGRMLGVER